MRSKVRRQAGVIPYRGVDEVEVLLVTSVRRGAWIVPKGVVEPHLGMHLSAEAEGWEEAGVRGVMHIRAAGTWLTRRGRQRYAITLFPLLVHQVAEVWPESDLRRRMWVSRTEAASHVDDPELAAILATFQPPWRQRQLP